MQETEETQWSVPIKPSINRTLFPIDHLNSAKDFKCFFFVCIFYALKQRMYPFLNSYLSDVNKGKGCTMDIDTQTRVAVLMTQCALHLPFYLELSCLYLSIGLANWKGNEGKKCKVQVEPIPHLLKSDYVSFSYLSKVNIWGKVVHWTLTHSQDLQIFMSQ